MSERSAIRQHAFFQDKEILSIEKLHGGLNHSVHKVVTRGQAVVTRCTLDHHFDFPELKLQRELAASGYTPGVLSWDSNIALIEYASGEHPGPAHWSEGQLARFARLLADVHRHKPNCDVLTLDLDAHIEQYVKDTNFCADGHRLMLKCRSRLAKLQHYPPSPGLCHHDLNPLNIIIDGGRIWLIDWESAAQGDVFFDLAGFIIEQQIDDKSARYLLDAYFSRHPLELAPLEVNDKLQLMKIAYCLVCWIWYLQRQQNTKQRYCRTEWYQLRLQELLS